MIIIWLSITAVMASKAGKLSHFCFWAVINTDNSQANGTPTFLKNWNTSQTWVCFRITWGTYCIDSWITIRGSDSGDWGGAEEFGFLASSQMLQMLLVQNPPWELQVCLRDTAGLVPDHRNTADSTIKWVIQILGFPSADKSYVCTVLLSVQ